MRRPTRLGLIGAGGIGRAYLSAARGLETAEFTAIADPDPGVDPIAAEHGVTRFDDACAMVEAGLVDAVLIATPPATHVELGLRFLEAGIPVLLEKPLAIDTDGAIALVTAAAERGTVLTMASKFRYVDDVIRARKIVQSGILGDILLFENSFTSKVDMSSRWNSNPAISGGGVLIDNGTHSVDIARYFLGPIAEVMAVEGARTQDVAVEDTAKMFLRSTGGALGTVDLSWSLTKGSATYVEVYGTRGTVRVGWQESAYRQDGGDWVPFGSGYRKLDALRGQLANFVAAVEGTEPLHITAVDAIASVEVIEAAYRSIETKQWIPVADRLSGAARAFANGLVTLDR